MQLDTKDKSQSSTESSADLGPNQPLPIKQVLRTAGILLLVNDMLALVEQIVDRSGAQKSFTGSLLAVAIDIGIAQSFIQGRSTYRTFAIFRIAAGLLVYGGIHISQRDFITPVVMAVGYSGLLAILIGHPRRSRFMTGTFMYGAMALMEVIGIVVMLSSA